MTPETTPDGLPDGPPPEDDLLAARARLRRGQGPGIGPGTGPLRPEAVPDDLLDKLASRWQLRPDAPAGAAGPDDAMADDHLRARAARGRPAPAGAPRDPDPDRLAALRARRKAGVVGTLEASLAAAGEIPRLAEAARALDELQIARKLADLSSAIRALVPEAPPELGALAKEGAKQAFMNSLNPALAASLATADAAKRIRDLTGWQGMSREARIAHVAALGANMADIVGAVAPPPANVAAQAMGVGLGLVALASDPSVGRRKTARTGRLGTPGTGRLPAVEPPPAKPKAPPERGTRLLAERRDNLEHNVRDRLQSAKVRFQDFVEDQRRAYEARKGLGLPFEFPFELPFKPGGKKKKKK